MNAPEEEKIKEKKKTILTIDDDPISCEILQTFLGPEGYDVVSADDGIQGLKAYQELKPDLIITDLFMPVMDGWEFLKKIRLMDSLIPNHPLPA